MTLSEYIEKFQAGNHAAFGRLLACERLTVLRYCTGEREPDALMRALIIKKTKGAVTLDDMHQTRLDWLKLHKGQAA